MQTDARAGGVLAGWNHHAEIGPTGILRADGATVVDESGRTRLDFIMGWGSLLLGHRPAAVADALRQALDDGFGFQYEGPPTVDLAAAMCEQIPCAQKVRLANSGLEATMYAIRLARHFTGRSRVLKFEGHFHGLNDFLLYNTDNSAAPGQARPDGSLEVMSGSDGLARVLESEIIPVPFNDLAVLERVFAGHGQDIGAVICEPIAMNIGCIAPDDGFLAALREICDRYQTVLIFDEVLTGYRVALGGAQQLFGVTPDLACYGKAFGCGVPIAAVAGRADIMECLAPPGTVEMSGTNTARRMCVLGARAALAELSRPGFYAELGALNDYLVAGLRRVCEDRGVPAYVTGYGGRVGLHIGVEERPRTMAQIAKFWNRSYHVSCYRHIAARQQTFGLLLPLRLCPEPITVCAVHTRADIDLAFSLLDDAFSALPYRRADS